LAYALTEFQIGMSGVIVRLTPRRSEAMPLDRKQIRKAFDDARLFFDDGGL